MVVSNVNKKVVEIVARKLFELREKNPDCKKYYEQLKMYGTSLRQAKGHRSVKPQVLPNIVSGCSSTSCIGRSVIDILVRRPKLFSFKETCAILSHCDLHENLSFVEETIRKYGIVIIGLPECEEQDLPLAVFFFIEDMFGIKPKIELCSRIVEEGEANMIGVIFEDIVTKQQIAEKHRILEGSGIVIDTYFDINWVVDGLYTE